MCFAPVLQPMFSVHLGPHGKISCVVLPGGSLLQRGSTLASSNPPYTTGSSDCACMQSVSTQHLRSFVHRLKICVDLNIRKQHQLICQSPNTQYQAMLCTILVFLSADNSHCLLRTACTETRLLSIGSYLALHCAGRHVKQTAQWERLQMSPTA